MIRKCDLLPVLLSPGLSSCRVCRPALPSDCKLIIKEYGGGEGEDNGKDDDNNADCDGSSRPVLPDLKLLARGQFAISSSPISPNLCRRSPQSNLSCFKLFSLVSF